jgi:hypothetical protein
VDATELLLAKALEYELMAVSLADASALSEANGPAALGFTVVAIVLREVADVFEEAA